MEQGGAFLCTTHMPSEGREVGEGERQGSGGN